MTEITIISGFLGAGKTTLIKKLLEEAFQGEKIVLIENEFGEIGIDGGFLKDAGIQVNEMNSGCICCSLVGDFGTALKEVLDTYAPDRILIEPSGVGKLSDVVKAVENVAGSMDVHIDSSIVVVDGKKCKMYMKNFGEFFNNQVEHAGTIVISRTQSMTDEKLEECAALLREHNAHATMITTPWDELDGKQILAAMHHAELEMEEHHHDHEEHHHEHDHDDEPDHDAEHCHDEHCHHHHHHEHHHEGESEDEYGIGSFVYYRRGCFDRQKLDKVADNWPKNIIRSKGLMWFQDEPEMAWILETTGRQISAGYSGAWLASAPKKEQEKVLSRDPEIKKNWDPKYGDRMIKLVIIGTHLDKKAISDLLDTALTDDPDNL